MASPPAPPGEPLGDDEAQSLPQPPTLADLPLEVLEAICSYSLDLCDRVRLVSCCPGLWRRRDVALSPALWGELTLTYRHLRTRRHRASLAEWLARRAGVVAVLRLWSDIAEPLPELLGSLAGDEQPNRLKELEVSGRVGGAELASLARLPRLRRLVLACCALEALPPGEGLPTLCHLDVSHNQKLGENVAVAFEVLVAFQQLTSLHIADCGIDRLRPAVGALSGLQELCVAGNKLCREESVAFAPLKRLSALTRLDLAQTGIVRLPEQVSALAGLRELELAGCGALEGSGLESLEACRQLTYLGLSAHRLGSSLQPLSLLTGLSSLDLSCSEDVPTAADLVPLRTLTRLTRLALYKCRLHNVPPVLECLVGLVELSLWGNFFSPAWDNDEHGPVSFAPLARLPALALVDVGESGVADMPPELVALEERGVTVAT